MLLLAHVHQTDYQFLCKITKIRFFNSTSAQNDIHELQVPNMDDDVEWLRVNLELFEDDTDDEEEDCEDDADGPSRDNDEPHLRWLQRDGELHTSN